MQKTHWLGNCKGQWSEILRNLSVIGQLGLSLLTPTVGCLLLCMFLQQKFSLGGWIFIPGLILGLGSSATTGWKFAQVVLRSESRKDEEAQKRGKGTFFNQHR